MKINPITGTGISGYEAIMNLMEMDTLASLDERAAEVCESFKTNKPSYFTKEECQLIHAVLSTFVADYKHEENAFLNKLKEQTAEKKEAPQTIKITAKRNPKTEGRAAVFQKGENFFYADRSYVPGVGMETMIFPCDKNGNVTDWTEAYSDRSEMSLEQCIEKFLAEEEEDMEMARPE